MAKNPDIDLVLTNINMPLMNGYEATKQIRKFKPDLPINATIAYAQTGDEHHVIEAGCIDYLAKPLHFEQLDLMIQKHTAKPLSD